jgi:CheY-like chemotaxis protein
MTRKARIVLLALKSDSARDHVQRELEADGCVVLPARDGHEALSRLRGLARPVVAVVDLLLPGMDGWDLIARLRGDPELSRSTVVAVCGQAREPVKGADHVVKDAAPSVILELVRSFLGSRCDREP